MELTDIFFIIQKVGTGVRRVINFHKRT